MSKSGARDISYEFNVLSKEWSTAGRRLGQPGNYGCVVADCRSLAFVSLRTGSGSRPVCFRHYRLLDEFNELAD